MATYQVTAEYLSAQGHTMTTAHKNATLEEAQKDFEKIKSYSPEDKMVFAPDEVEKHWKNSKYHDDSIAIYLEEIDDDENVNQLDCEVYDFDDLVSEQEELDYNSAEEEYGDYFVTIRDENGIATGVEYTHDRRTESLNKLFQKPNTTIEISDLFHDELLKVISYTDDTTIVLWRERDLDNYKYLKARV